MRILTEPELTAIARRAPPTHASGSRGSLSTLKASELTGVAGLLVDWVGQLQSSVEPVCIHIADYDIWPSSQHLPLFEAFAQAVGIAGRSPDKLSVLDDSPTLSDAISLMIIVLAFGWDATIHSVSSDRSVFVSHDEYLIVLGGEQVARDQLAARFS